MPRFLRLAALLLLAAWLPATLHCRIEAAGLAIPHHDDCAEGHHDEPADGCKDDLCPTVEDALIKDAPANPEVAAPADWVCAAGLAIVLAQEVAPLAPLSPERHPPPRELIAAWQFDLRAAPPAQAP